TFENAEGLVAGKTKFKYKDVEIGVVSTIDLLDDLSGVVVTAEMVKDFKSYMTENTSFWVVRARVAAGEVSGLGTLLSGAYIGCIPSDEGQPVKNFAGLEKPPVMTAGLPGRHFTLHSETLGSLDVGSPILYRGIKVGQVVDYDFDEAAESINFKIFIDAPFHEKVRKNSRFWNASGIDFTMDASGIKMDTQSLVSILLGGVAFDNSHDVKPGEQAEESKRFELFASHDESKKKIYTYKEQFLLYFDQSVRGLSPGAPVEIKGIKIGEVVSIELQYDQGLLNFRIPVLVMIEPERLNAVITEEGQRLTGNKMHAEIDETNEEEDRLNTKIMIRKGFRAQLKTGNLLTGQLYIDFDFYPDAAPAELIEQDGILVFPTIPVPLKRIIQRVDNILEQVEQVPFAQMGKDVGVVVKNLNTLLKDLSSVSVNVNRETLPKINGMIDELQKTLKGADATLKGIDATLGEGSSLNYSSLKVMDELSMTIRSLRSLLDYLERDPQALILGKKGEKK
ncbi:MAG: MCE family protein, partial [Desulfobulbaceae bacterium]|nr:MCE family protein [Desulfobulbaceae bacterium]